jgi:hypothetical protein
MIKNLTSLLEIDTFNCFASLSNLSEDERVNMKLERSRCMDTICIKIKSLLNNLESKEKLLKDYELDLAKLRQAEFLLQKKSDQLEYIQNFSQNKEDENQLLQELLKSTKSKLEKEKHKNISIKQNKVC